MLLTAGLLPGVVFLVLFLLNFIALHYKTTNVIPFTVMVTLVLYWGVVSFPLVIGGTILGRVWGGKSRPPCRVNNLPRPIPPRRWYTQPIVVAAVAGILPFGSIFIEMYFVFTSFWNYKFYYVYGFMLLVYVILIIVSSCVTIVAMYYLLNAEGECCDAELVHSVIPCRHVHPMYPSPPDYRWPWMSFVSAGSTAVYVFLYSVYYFVAKTKYVVWQRWYNLSPCASRAVCVVNTSMAGFLQTCFYFGYMGLFCVTMLILCGTIGVASASAFVHRIYRNIKID